MRRAVLWLWVVSLLTMQAHHVMPHYHHHHDLGYESGLQFHHHHDEPEHDHSQNLGHSEIDGSSASDQRDWTAAPDSAGHLAEDSGHFGHLHPDEALQKERRSSRSFQDTAAVLADSDLSIWTPIIASAIRIYSSPEVRTAGPPRDLTSRGPPRKFSQS